MRTFYIYIFYFAILSFSCDKEKNSDSINNIDNLQINMSCILDTSNIKIIYDFQNNDSSNYIFPLTYWIFMGMDDPNFFMIAEPNNPFILNTIHYYPTKTKLKGLMEMDKMQQFNKMPFFLRISKNQRYKIEVIFKRLYMNNANIYNRFSKQYNYKILSKISLLPESVFLELLKELSIDKYKDSFIVDRKRIILKSNKNKIVVNENFMESNILLNKNDYIKINKKFREKIKIYSIIDTVETLLNY